MRFTVMSLIAPALTALAILATIATVDHGGLRILPSRAPAAFPPAPFLTRLSSASRDIFDGVVVACNRALARWD